MLFIFLFDLCCLFKLCYGATTLDSGATLQALKPYMLIMYHCMTSSYGSSPRVCSQPTSVPVRKKNKNKQLESIYFLIYDKLYNYT